MDARLFDTPPAPPRISAPATQSAASRTAITRIFPHLAAAAALLDAVLRPLESSDALDRQRGVVHVRRETGCVSTVVRARRIRETDTLETAVTHETGTQEAGTHETGTRETGRVTMAAGLPRSTAAPSRDRPTVFDRKCLLATDSASHLHRTAATARVHETAAAGPLLETGMVQAVGGPFPVVAAMVNEIVPRAVVLAAPRAEVEREGGPADTTLVP